MAFGDDLFGTDPSDVVDSLLRQQAPDAATGTPVNQRVVVDRLTRKMMQPSPAPAVSPEPVSTRVRAPAPPKSMQTEPDEKAPDFSDLAEKPGEGADFSDLADPVEQPRYNPARSALTPEQEAAAKPSAPSAISRGFVTGMMKESPENFAEALEGFSRLTVNPDMRGVLETLSKDVRGITKLSPEEYAKRSGSMWDIKNLDEAMTWIGEQFGSGVASSVPSMVGGVGGGYVGGRIGGKVGAKLGVLGGAAAPAFAQNYGDVYKALKDEKVDPDRAAELSLYAGGAMAALDTASIGPIIQRLGGWQEARRALARGLAKRIGQEGLKGAGAEGVTEALQEMVKDAAISYETNKDFFTTENLKGWIENGAAGAITGGGMRAATGIRPDEVAPAGAATPAPGAGAPPAGGPAGTGGGTAPGAGPQPGGSPGGGQGAATGNATPPPQSTPGEIDDFLQQAGGQPVDRRPDDVRRGAQTRQEIDDFIAAKDAGQSPTMPQDQAAAGPTAQDVQRAVLREAGWMERAIDEMSEPERAQAAQQALDEGVNADEAVKKHFKPAGTRANPIVAETADDVIRASQRVLPAPSDKQASAENYRHAHLDLPQLGLTGAQNISIETGVGGTRRGTDADGQPWEVQMPAAYGRIKGTKGADGQPLDIYIGPAPTNPMVYVIDQIDPKTGKFDEHKIMAGFASPIDALRHYDAAFTGGGRDRIGGVTPLTADQFKAWLASGETTKALKQPEGKKTAAGTDTQRAPAAESVGSQTEVPKAAGEPTQDASTDQNAPTPETVPADLQKNLEAAAEPDAAEHIDDVLEVLGDLAKDVLPADVMRAAEIMADTGKDAATAFQEAVIDHAVDTGYLTLDEVYDAYGEQIKELLADTAAAPERGQGDLQEGSERQPEQAAGERDGEAGVVPSRGEAGSERTEADAGSGTKAGRKRNTKRSKPDAAGVERDAGREADRGSDGADAAAGQGAGDAGVNLPAKGTYVEIAGKRMPFDGDYAKLSKAYRRTIEETDATSSGRTGPMAPEAKVIGPDGKTLAHVSFNGRVWSGPAPSEPDWSNDTTTILYDPSGEIEVGDSPYKKALRAKVDEDGRRNEGKPLDDTKYPKPEVTATEAPIDEGIVPLTMDAASFKEITQEWADLFKDPDRRVQTAKRAGPFIPIEEAQKRIDEWRAHAEKQADENRQINSTKTILSLFDLSGEWSRPWAEAGYNVLTFDIQNGQDINDFSVEYFNENYDISDVDGILIAQPCTDFAVSGAKHFAAKDADGRTQASKELVFQALRTVEYFRPRFWVLENPVSRIEEVAGLPKARMTFEPHHFGETYTKKTVLWGKFNAELPTANVDPVEGSKMHKKYGGKSKATKNARSVTPEGFAYAFFMANNYVDAKPIDRLLAKYPEASGAIKQAVEAGVTEDRINELMYDTYENYEYEDARNALINEVAFVKEGRPLPEPKDTRTPEEIAAAEAPTWAEVLAQLPMHSDGRTRQHEIAFSLMSEITGTKNPAFNDLTPAQKVELLDLVKKPPKDDVTLAFDEIFGPEDEPAPKPKRERKARGPRTGEPRKRTAKQAGASAAKHTSKALNDALDGLIKLFGGNKLSSGLTFDEETYAQAKPFFTSAARELVGAWKDMREFARLLVDALQEKGMPFDGLRKMRPYLEHFSREVRDGKLDLKESTNEPAGTEGNGSQALDEAPAEEGAGLEAPGDAGGKPARGGQSGTERDRDPAEGGVSGARGEGGGAAEAHSPAAGAGGRRAKSGTGKARTRVSEAPAGAEGGRGADADPVNIPAVNFRITDDVNLGQGSETTKFNDNIAAIETLRQIEAENRRATPEEQRILARYVGWGGLASAFRNPEGHVKDDWRSRADQLEGLLTPDELRAARASTRNAHYTSKTVVDAMWKAAQRLGFKGGLALEMSAGTGNFLGLMPEEIAGSTKFVAIEYDSITARIAKLLYPNETVLHAGLHQVPLPEGEAVLNIGNPPFGSESLRFQYKPEVTGLSIHNQFFVAGLDALQPGGLQIMVVSRYLMDAQDTKAREMLATKADLLGAIRLPDTAFKENARTEVVTDILFLQRRTSADEQEMEKTIALAKASGKTASPREIDDAKRKLPRWIKTDKVKDPLGGEPMEVNAYFRENPRMVMGRLERSGSMRQKGDVNVKLEPGSNFAEMLDAAIDRLPQNVLDLHKDAIDRSIARHKTMSESLEIALSGNEVGHVERNAEGKLIQISERETPSGGYEPVRREITAESPWSRQLLMDKDGNWYTLEPAVDEKGAKVKAKGGRNVYERKYFANNVVPASMRLGKTKFDRLSDLVAIRDLVKRQLVLEAQDAKASEMEGNRKKLAGAYRDYTSKNGLLNDPANMRIINELPDGALISALEFGYREPITATKAARTGEKARPASAQPAPIMSRRVVMKYEAPTSADTPQDALFITLSETGRPDIDRIAELLGKDRDTTIETMTEGDSPLLYKDPETGAYETANAYLSGNVVRKLKAATEAGLEKNVRALEKIQPERWSAENVTAMIGANWIPASVYNDFAKHLFKTDTFTTYSKVTNSFQVVITGKRNQAAMDQWRTEDITPEALINGLLNSRVPKIVREDSDGRRYVDQEASALVAQKAREIENEFSDWVFADTARRNKLVDIYNDKFNTRVNRQHDGSHLTLPGKVPDEVIRLRRHQKNAVWRGIYERFMLLDHVVGAGKTFTAIARAMERRRMGLSRKPAVVVPNHLVDQWAADVYRLYPGAKVLAAGKNQFDRKNRRRLFAKIATGDWDIVIVPHSSFGFIGIAPETETRFLDEELRIALEAVKEAEEAAAEAGISNGRKPFNVKEAERLVETIRARMDGLKKATRDRMLTFEQLGIDDLTVDEAHEFKNLFYSSRLVGVRGMGDKSGSQKAFDLYNKVRVLRESPTGTVTFMTGTPISNSAVEMYTMMRYLAADDLRDLGLEHFDAWRTQSVSAASKFEPTEAGGLKEVTRLGRTWSNMRALMELYYSFTDAVSQEDINRWYAEDNNGARFPVPKIKNGGRKEVVVKPTEAQQFILQQVVDGFNGLPRMTDPIERNAERLRLMDRARKVSLDARAVDPRIQSSEDDGKLDQIADNVKRIYDATSKDRGTQLVFLDRSVPSSKGDAKKIKEFDDLIAKRDAALAEGNERGYREAVEQLDTFDANEIETLRNAAKGGWNAYDQLKRNLVDRGIPAEEVRFVQEANSDLEKKALFDSVNDGSIRVLVGSTPRMGAGTNVQERLVALHHGDVTWKPSDIEQREGRIIRQGNKLLEKYGADNFEVEILAYVTERTVDAKMWDLNATKLRMINGIRKYDGSFTMEFDDEDAVGMAEIAALASGDPLLMERVKLMAEIDKLELLERAHRRKMFGLDDTIYSLEQAKKEYPARIERGLQRKAKAFEGREAMRAAAEGRSVEIEGKSYSFEEFGAARDAILKAIETQQAGDEKAKYAININGQRATSKDAINAAIADTLGDAVPIDVTIDGKRLISRSKIALALTAKANELRNSPRHTIDLGQFAGFDAAMSFTSTEDRGEYLALTLSHEGETFVDQETKIKPGEIPTITVRSLFDKVEADLTDLSHFTGEWMAEKIRQAEDRLPGLYEQKGKPFDKAADLKNMRDRLGEVTRILSERTAAEEGGGSRARDDDGDEGILAQAQENVAADDFNWSDRVLQQRDKIEQLVRDFIRSIAGPGVAVEFNEGLIPDESGEGRAAGWGTISIAGFKGQYLPFSRIIRLALYGSGDSFNGTMFHEAYHHVATWLMPDNIRRLMQGEIPRLRDMVRVYKGYTKAEAESLADAEIEAIAAEAWFRGVQSGVHVGLRRWFASMANAIRRLYNGLRGLGFNTAEDVFGDIKAGKYAKAEQRAEPSDHPGSVEAQASIAPSSRRAPLQEEAETIAETLTARGWGRLARVAKGFGLGNINPTEVRTLLQDKFIRIRNIEQANPGLPLSQRAYQAESLYYGRTGQRLENLERTMIDPLIDDMRARNVTLDELDSFLYARHAPERNAHIASINPALPQDGSGMSDADAQQIIDDIDNAGRRPDFDALEQRVRDIITTTRATLLHYGLISQEMHDLWEDQYDNYVPLRGFNDGIEDVDGPGGIGMGFDTRAREAQRALGRSSEAFSPLAYTLMQAEWAIVRGEKNVVGNTWLRFVQNNPDPTRWEVNRPKVKRTFDERTGMVVNRMDREVYDNEFITKVGGQPYIITHHGAHGLNIARALRNMGSSNANSLVRFIGMLTRTIARINTQYSPEFMIANFERDLGEALINMNEQQRAGFKRSFLRHLPRAFGGVFQGLSGRGTGPYAQAFREFDRAGGRIRFFGLEDADDVQARIEQRFNRLGSGILNSARRGLEHANDAWEIVTGTNENAVRLAVYMAARDHGYSIAESAAIARNMTVNFNRRGEWGQFISALYAFGNAGIQGIFRMAQALKDRNVQIALGTMIGVSAAITAFNIGAGGDDDEGRSLYLKVPSYVRDKNLILMWPKGWGRDGQYIQWRLPIGFAMFYVLGAELTALAMGKQKPGKAFETVMGSVLEAINPFGQDQNRVAMLLPTLARPAVHVETNKSWTGRPIYPEGRNADKPDSSQYFKSASEFSVWLAGKMNSISGGDPYRKGWVDVHPGTIDTYLQFMSGGVGRFTMATAGTIGRASQGEFDASKTPFVRQVVGKVPENADDFAYREQSKKARDAKSTVNDAIRDRKAGKATEENERVIRQGSPKSEIFRQTDRQIKQLREASDRIKADKSLSAQEQKDRITILESRIRQLENQAMRSAR